MTASPEYVTIIVFDFSDFLEGYRHAVYDNYISNNTRSIQPAADIAPTHSGSFTVTLTLNCLLLYLCLQQIKSELLSN